MGSRFLGNDEYAGPAEPGRDGFPISRERRSGQPGMGSRLARERRLGCRGWVPTGTTSMGSGGWGAGWVPVCTGTTVGQPRMGSRLHGNDGGAAGDGFPFVTGTTAGGRERDWGCGILWGVAWECRFAGFWVCMRLCGRLAGVFFAGVAARVGGLHAGAARAVSRPSVRRRFFFPPLWLTCSECACGGRVSPQRAQREEGSRAQERMDEWTNGRMDEWTNGG